MFHLYHRLGIFLGSGLAILLPASVSGEESSLLEVDKPKSARELLLEPLLTSAAELKEKYNVGSYDVEMVEEFCLNPKTSTRECETQITRAQEQIAKQAARLAADAENNKISDEEKKRQSKQTERLKRKLRNR